MNIPEYIESIGKRYALGNATEHTFRGDLQSLIESLVPDVAATNEPKRIACGAPDYVITRKDIPLGYIEAKDIDTDLGGTVINEQRERYVEALDNLVFTDYLEFRFFMNGEATSKIRIGEVRGNKIVGFPDEYERFEDLIKDFCSQTAHKIRSAKELAEMMADKAKLLAYVIKNALDSDEETQANSTLKEQLKAFKLILIHDIDEKQFADVYAQTIAYGMFAARLHDPTLDTFSRQEAAENIPKTNPFLRQLFQYIAGYDLDSRIKWIVDALADLFRAADVASILKNFGKSTQTHDPIMHFYETFLAEYDPKLRKARGVYYTPEPVVDFIVRAVDDILKTEFGLKDGLADTSKTKVKEKQQKLTVEKEYHRVQILDPATGTGTFLAQVIKQIYKGFENQQGVWSQYVDQHLIPRLNGFELLMASYAMAHLKLDLLLSETGYKPSDSSADAKRFQIYLTNSLEEHHPETGTLWASWLSNEANEANHIKRDTPVMVVIGNPPYSVSSSNKSKWIEDLMVDYKRDLKEKNINSLSDDYLKFIRFGQHFIDKNGEGILAYISNNSFIDGITHRQMRKYLLESFDAVYVVDLHGNSNKKEAGPEGTGKDENVFDIQQGVSINIFVKKSANREGDLGDVFHFDLFGTREAKYRFLLLDGISNIAWEKVISVAPEYFFVPKDVTFKEEYDCHFSINDLFETSNVGLNTEFDELALHETEEDAKVLLESLLSLSESEIIQKYDLPAKSLAKVVNARNDIKTHQAITTRIVYRPFDTKNTVYTGVSNGLMGRPRHTVMRNMLSGKNLGLVTMRQYAYNVPDYCYSFITRDIVASRLFISNKGYCTICPLYIYPNLDAQQNFDGRTERVPNLNSEIVDKIAVAIGLTFVAERVSSPTVKEGSTRHRALTNVRATDTSATTFAPIDILDYIYAVLHSPSYREKYKEFLKIDFPRVPYPRDAETFWKLVELGGEIRQIHLLESPKVEQFITGYPVGGSNEVVKPEYKDGKVFINTDQHFAGVPEIAWNFYIGGYQPAQKWLKDRKGRSLTFDDIRHYQKIIVALTETDRLMKEIDKIDFIEAA